jgi:hypothetical protein
VSGTLSLLPEDEWLEVGGVRVPTQLAVLPWQAAGRSFTATGYGRRIPTTRRVQLPGSPRWRRVYVCIYSNAGTAYVDGPRDPATGKRPWFIVHSSGRY